MDVAPGMVLSLEWLDRGDISTGLSRHRQGIEDPITLLVLGGLYDVVFYAFDDAGVLLHAGLPGDDIVTWQRHRI